MKILLANKFFFPKGGSETVFFQERDYLLRQGIPVIDFSMRHPDNSRSEYSDYFAANTDYHAEKTNGVWKTLTTAIDFVHNRKAINTLNRLIQEEKPDIAHLHNIYHQITPAIIPVLKKHGIKVIMTLHDYKLICPSYSMIDNDLCICDKCSGKFFWHCAGKKCQSDSRFKSLLLAIEGYWHKWAGSYDMVDLFLSPSTFLAELMVKHRIDRKKILVLHNGIDTDVFSYSEKDAGYAVYFGRISREKGIKTLLKAYQSLNTKLELKIVGTGPLLHEMQEEYPWAEYTGYKTGDELYKLIGDSSFVVVPSEWYENCSMTVLEAMAIGKPVIGSRIGGIPEQIEDGKTGFLFEMANAGELANKVDILTKNKDLRLNMGRAAREKLENEYSLTHHCDKLLQTYEELPQEKS